MISGGGIVAGRACRQSEAVESVGGCDEVANLARDAETALVELLSLVPVALQDRDLREVSEAGPHPFGIIECFPDRVTGLVVSPGIGIGFIGDGNVALQVVAVRE